MGGQIGITFLMIMGRQYPGGQIESIMATLLVLLTIFTTIMAGL